MITIEKKSDFTGQTNSMEIPLSEEEYQESYSRFISGSFVQDAFPTLTPNQREFILTGTTPEEWDRLFPDE